MLDPLAFVGSGAHFARRLNHRYTRSDCVRYTAELSCLATVAALQDEQCIERAPNVRIACRQVARRTVASDKNGLPMRQAAN